jgi:hypothetical protein
MQSFEDSGAQDLCRLLFEKYSLTRVLGNLNRYPARTPFNTDIHTVGASYSIAKLRLG